MNKTHQPIHSLAIEDAIRNQFNKRVADASDRRAKEAVRYETKLKEMIIYTLSLIDTNTSPDQLNEMLRIGDKEWRAVCARARLVKKYLQFNIEAYKDNIMRVLIERKIIISLEKNVLSTTEEAIIIEDKISSEVVEQIELSTGESPT